MTVPRLKKASKSSDAPSRKNSRSDAFASDASDQINGIFGPVGSRTRSRSTSASALTMKTALDQHLDKIAIKKEMNAKEEARVMNMSRSEQKQPKVSARVKEMPSITQHDHDSSSAHGVGTPVELRAMPEGDSQASLESTSGTQDLAMEDAMRSAEFPGSQLSVRSLSQISQGIYDDGTPEELRGMLGSRPNSDEDDDTAPELVGSDDEDEDEDARIAEAAPQAATLMDTCLKCKRPTGETDCIICEQSPSTPFGAPASAPTPTTTSYTHLHIRWLSE